MARKSANTEDDFAGFDHVQLIGAGSFADVYQGVDISTNQNVALKVLHATVKELGDNNTFDLETRALGTLSAHPNIVTLYRTTVLRSGRPMLVLELCDRSLSDQILTSGPIHPRMVVRFAIQIAGAVESAHRSGILHRDIKPQNILMSRYGVPLLADFGVANMKNASGHEYAVSGLSVLHAPPEILWDKEATPKSDVYTLASTMYELLCGRSPFFITDSENAAAVRLRILNQAPPPLSVADMPPKLWDILSRALAKDPSQRQGSALEFAQDLRAIEQLQGWPETECVVDGITELGAPDPTRLKTRLTGSVLNVGALPGLGDLGRDFGANSQIGALPDLNPISEVRPQLIALDSRLIDSPADIASTELNTPSVSELAIETVSPEPTATTEETSAPPLLELEPTPPKTAPMLGLFAPLSGDTEIHGFETHTSEQRLLGTVETQVFPSFDTPPAQPVPAPSSMLRDVTDPIPLSTPIHDESEPLDVTPDDPSAVPGEVLWGYTPLTGITGTIQLNPKDRLSGSRPNDDPVKNPKRPRLGKIRKKRD